MSGITSAFDQLYSMQTRVLGVAILATVTGHAANVPALLGGVSNSDAFGSGATTMPGDAYLLQIKQSDMPTRPIAGVQVTCNGSADTLTLQVTGTRLVNAIWEVTVGDISA